MMPQDKEIKARERAFHDNRFGQHVDPRAKLDGVYSITAASTMKFRTLLAQDFPHAGNILEYGCGTGGDFDFYKKLNPHLYGIDISEEAIQKAQTRAMTEGLSANFKVGDAESTGYENNIFDRIVGLGILHHLDLEKSLPELARIIKQEGGCIFSEPLGHNPIINFFRFLTPKLRTPDEHPLKNKDFDLMRIHFNEVNIEYFYILTFLSLPFRRTAVFKPVYRFLAAADGWMFRNFPWLGKYAWICIIELRAPKKSENSVVANG